MDHHLLKTSFGDPVDNPLNRGEALNHALEVHTAAQSPRALGSFVSKPFFEYKYTVCCYKEAKE